MFFSVNTRRKQACPFYMQLYTVTLTCVEYLWCMIVVTIRACAMRLKDVHDLDLSIIPQPYIFTQCLLATAAL